MLGLRTAVARQDGVQAVQEEAPGGGEVDDLFRREGRGHGTQAGPSQEAAQAAVS